MAKKNLNDSALKALNAIPLSGVMEVGTFF